MSTLTGKYPSATYKQLLQVGSANVGLSSSLQTVQDGNGASSALQISTSAVKSLGTFNVVGAATFATINGITVTTSSGTFTLANSKTFTVSNTLTLTGTDSSSVAFGAGGTVAYTGNKLSVFTATSSSELAGVISDETGSGSLVFANTPTLVTPILGTPTSGTLTTCTGLPISTGVSGLAAGIATFLGTSSSANLGTALTDKTGTGVNVFATSPTLTTPTIGAATVTSLNGVAIPSAFDLPIQRVSTLVVTSTTGTTLLPVDDTIPQITEGNEYMTLAVTPKSSSNILRIDVTINLASSAAQQMGAAIFQDATANALNASFATIGSASSAVCIHFTHIMTAGTTSATTFRIRAGGNNAGTTTFNGLTGARVYGGVLTSSIVITEYAS